MQVEIQFYLTYLCYQFAQFFLQIYRPLARTIGFEQKTQTCKGSVGMHPNSQEKERREAESREKEREENLALNEVLREEHNAMCTVLKDFSSVGVFLY